LQQEGDRDSDHEAQENGKAAERELFAVICQLQRNGAEEPVRRRHHEDEPCAEETGESQ
jgi:hypothetical protein